MTINEIVKNYSLNEEKMKQIRDAMEIASCAIERDEPGRCCTGIFHGEKVA